MASSFIGSLTASGFASKPLLFLAHSLGGMVLKEALDRERQMLRRVGGAILFGVPSRGMETQALLTIVRGQANEATWSDEARTLLETVSNKKVDNETISKEHDSATGVAKSCMRLLRLLRPWCFDRS
jgi:predicted alpha/beta hydrolase family esterase